MALGSIGMSYADFAAMTVPEFTAIYDAWRTHEYDKERAEWERVRTVGVWILQPYMKKKLTPKELLRFPWDNDKPKDEAVGGAADAGPSTAERFSALLDKIAR